MFEKTVLKRLSKADLFSILNALFGITSILLIPNLKLSFIFLLFAILADGMDGSIARKYGSSLAIIDEFADMISFVAFPSAIFFYKYGFFSIPFIYLYVIASIIHLLNYHYGKKDGFIGLPTPASSIIITIACLLSFPLSISLAILIILSILTASPIYYPRIEGIARVFAGSIILITAIYPHTILIYILFILTLAYIIFAPLEK